MMTPEEEIIFNQILAREKPGFVRAKNTQISHPVKADAVTPDLDVLKQKAESILNQSTRSESTKHPLDDNDDLELVTIQKLNGFPRVVVWSKSQKRIVGEQG